MFSQVRELNRKQKVANATCVHLMRSLVSNFKYYHIFRTITRGLSGITKGADNIPARDIC